jgi:hypothetical protein
LGTPFSDKLLGLLYALIVSFVYGIFPMVAYMVSEEKIRTTATERSGGVPARRRCPVRRMGGLWAYRSARPETSIPGNLNVEQPLNR